MSGKVNVHLCDCVDVGVGACSLNDWSTAHGPAPCIEKSFLMEFLIYMAPSTLTAGCLLCLVPSRKCRAGTGCSLL